MRLPFSAKTYRSVELSTNGPVLTSHTLNEQWDDNVLIVRPIVVGICRSDIKEVQGVRQVRKDFGHEIIGLVEWTNFELPLMPGDFVCFDPHIPVKRTSGFGELIVATGTPTNLRHAFLKVTPSTSLTKMVFLEPMGCASHCVSNLLTYKGIARLDNMKVGVIGAGIAGTLIALIAKFLGATVTLFNRSFNRLEFLEKTQLFLPTELQPLNVESSNHFDVVIPATSFLYPSILASAVRFLKPHGLLLLYGGTRENDFLPETALNIDLIRRQEQHISVFTHSKSFYIGGTHGALLCDFENAYKYLEESPGHFSVEKLITAEITLDQLPHTLETLALSEENYLGKTIVRLSSDKNPERPQQLRLIL